MPQVMMLPKIGVNMTDALIVEWVVKEGDTIQVGDHILDAETDKAVQEIQAMSSGVLAKILVQAGETVLIQAPIAILTEPGEIFNEDFSGKEAAVQGVATTVSSGKVPSSEERAVLAPSPGLVVNGVERVKITPIAKKLSLELGVDYTQIKPAKPGARIVKEDILAFYERFRPVENVVQSTCTGTSSLDAGITGAIPLVGTRKVIAERMSESNNTKPAVALTLHADVGTLLEWRLRLKKSGKAVSFNDFLVAIVAKALNEFPFMNSRLQNNEIQLIRDVNIGVAVDSEKGLVVPVIHQADKKGLMAIHDDFQEKLERVKAGKSTLEDFSGGTFSITNLGMLEIEVFTPIINPPECCILAVGSIVREPVVVDDNDTIAVRPRMQLTLMFDHRIVDGAPAARFLQRIKHLVEWPLDLIS